MSRRVTDACVGCDSELSLADSTHHLQGVRGAIMGHIIDANITPVKEQAAVRCASDSDCDWGRHTLV